MSGSPSGEVSRQPAQALPRRAAAAWHDVECGSYHEDLPVWRAMVELTLRPAGGSCELLELGCGTGRVSLALAGDGCRVTAVDIEPELIAVIRERALERRLSVEAAVGDVRSLGLGRRFDLVIAPMQLVQLIRVRRERLRMLRGIVRHLEPTGRAAIALLDLDEQWEAAEEEAPLPDMLEVDGWVYSSQPVAVRRIARDSWLELDRVRRLVSPGGELARSLSRVRLALISPGELEQEALRAGLLPERRLAVPATAEHVASVVVVLRPDPTATRR